MSRFKNYFNDIEFISSISHLLFGFVSFFFSILLIKKTMAENDPIKIFSLFIFGISVALLYISSGLYHLVPKKSELKYLFKRLDHIMIFVLISGSYTPFCLIVIKGGIGWSMFVSLWIITILGIFFKIFWIHAPRLLYTSIYLIMGWVGVVAIYPLYTKLNLMGISWLISGGILYTVGAIVYALKKPDPFPKIFGFHEIWHIFVILGTTSHFVAVSTII
ncbi:MAG: hemolysin III family protein [Calditerrivibrio sp.]|nr:hemolysin III family protein [Calditerrivibrio sp.]MCA1980802.1 hemolysin III family protein [Calditerrivibrio sp.]